MTKTQQKRFQLLYQQHISALKRQGSVRRPLMINVYSRAVRRITEHLDRCPDRCPELLVSIIYYGCPGIVSLIDLM